MVGAGGRQPGRVRQVSCRHGTHARLHAQDHRSPHLGGPSASSWPPGTADVGEAAVSRFGAGIRRGMMAADQFTQIANALFHDSQLSFKSKGILGYVSTHRNGWHVTIADLVRLGQGRTGSGPLRGERRWHTAGVCHRRLSDRGSPGSWGRARAGPPLDASRGLPLRITPEHFTWHHTAAAKSSTRA